MVNVIDLLLHLDKYLNIIITAYGFWVYALLFVIIFIETGFVIAPFLPGDSLIFVAGTLSAKDLLNPYLLFIILTLAAIGGDTVNYLAGKSIGKRIFREKALFLNKENLKKTEEFYERHGGKTIIYARFIPVIRTFAPFVAGIGNMYYPKFFIYNAVGGIAWVALFVTAGYFFGNVPLVKNNLTLVILILILSSFVPVIYEYLKHKIKKKREAYLRS